MKQKLKNLTPNFGLYDYWKQKVQTLEKKQNDIIISDFDDCIFCRKEQLEQSEILRTNRWDAGTQMIFNEIWVENYIWDFVKNKHFPSEIISQLNPQTDIILTAGIYENQMEKIKACWLENIKTIVVPTGEDKIIATIRYIIFDLQYIPKSITVFEDRPHFFIEYRDLIEDVLWTKLIIKKVVMNGNNQSPEITNV